MNDRLRFNDFYRHVLLPSEGVFLISEGGDVVLKGKTYLHIAPLLDGRYTADDIVDQLDGDVPPAEVYYALNLMREKGYIANYPASIHAERASFWQMLNLQPTVAEEHIAARAVEVIALGGMDASPMESMIAQLGIPIRTGAERRVVVTDDYLNVDLERLNREAIDNGRAWMLVCPTGIEPWIGPIFIPNVTACWRCLAQRLRGHRRIEDYLQEKTGVDEPIAPPRAWLPTSATTAMSMAATELARWIASDEPSPLEGTVLTLNVLTLNIERHRLTKRPQCPTCGSPEAHNNHTSIAHTLGRHNKAFTADGGHRVETPEETFARLEHHISRVTGIIGALRPFTSTPSPLTPSYATDHNFARMGDSIDSLRENLRGRSGGKGKADMQARVSAIGESIERYSGVYQGDEPRISARYDDLGATAIHPNDVMLFSDRQFEHRDEWNARGSHFNRVPERFDATGLIEWAPIWPMNGGNARYLPMACCYFGYAWRHGQTFATADSNGSAAGSTREEAILQGFMELVERDSVAIWWYNRLQRPAVDLASFNDPYIEKLAAYYPTLHRDLWVLDITSDLGIPSFAAVSRRTDKPDEDIIFGFGAHFDPTVALLRALTELNQSLPAVIGVDRGAGYLYPDGEAIDWWKSATIATHRYLTPDPTLARSRCDDYPKRWSEDLYDDVMTCADIVASHGMEMFALDQTRPDIGLNVVKVIVPGLRHFWARLAPGRLYDVPVKMGWRREPCAEEELNPTAMFF